VKVLRFAADNAPSIGTDQEGVIGHAFPRVIMQEMLAKLLMAVESHFTQLADQHSTHPSSPSKPCTFRR
jgi:hypothetical protein